MTRPDGFEVSGDFLHRRSAPGLDLFLLPTERFRTLHLRLYLLQPLAGASAAGLSLAASVLKQGSAGHPSRPALYGALDDLYGADLDLDTGKIGEAHVLEADLSLPAGRYTGDRGALGKALALLAEVLGEPRRVGRGLPRETLRRERRNLLDTIAAARNHRPSWANLRCLRLACAGEPYRIGRLGTPAALRAWTPSGLLRFWQQSLGNLPMAVYAVGDFRAPGLAARLEDALLPLRRGRAKPLPSGGFQAARDRKPKRATEAAALSQARLCLAFRTNTPWGDPAFPSLVLANAVLGGGSHAKLFQEVREKASLAYDASSSLDRTKGLLLLSAGVAPAQAARAETLILRQVEDLRAGRISDREWKEARLSHRNRVLTIPDSAARLISLHLEGWLHGRPAGAEEVLRRAAGVRPADAAEAARRWTPAATFLLTSGGRA